MIFFEQKNDLLHYCKHVFILLVLSTSFFIANGQQIRVKIFIKNSEALPVAYATVKAQLTTDTTKVVQKVTDQAGLAEMSLQSGKTYKVTASSVNYIKTEKVVQVNDQSEISIVLQASSGTVGNVVVTTTRPLMRQEDDKTIVDPETLAASSTNAFEILEKTPGLFVDQDGNVYLNSTSPAQIYINGREQRMSTTDISSMLKSLPPNTILRIEILRTPSAKYDASGGGGIVNIVLKKGVKLGLTGSINTGFNQGRFGNRFIGLNINNSSGNLTSFINIQYNRRNSFDQVTTDRLFAADSLLSQDAYTTYPAHSFYTGFGVGYQFGKKWELNYDGRISFTNSDNFTDNLNGIRKISTAEKLTDNQTLVNNQGRSLNIAQGLAAKYKIDTLGSEWTTDLSYNYSPNHTDQFFTNIFNSPAQESFQVTVLLI
jgi:hypothetical protein